MEQKHYLTLITDASPERDSIMYPKSLPLMRGNEDENLACGSCKAIIVRNASVRTIHQRFVTVATSRLIARCVCGADNLLPRHSPE